MKLNKIKRIVENKKVPSNFPNLSKVGEYVGSGLHGHVYKYGANQVIKFGDGWADNKGFRELSSFVKSTKRFSAIVKIYSVGRFKRDFYWIIMEYLPKSLSRRERNYLTLIEDYVDRIPLDQKKFKRLPNKWKTLARSMRRINKWYSDLHYDNVKKTKSGLPKVIDIETFVWDDDCTGM